MKRITPDFIGGLISCIIGIVSILEAVKLYPLRMSTFVGDHTMPGLLGAIMVILGVALIFQSRPFKAEMPEKQIMKVMLFAVAFLVVYCILIPYLGYILSTCLTSIALFKVFGSSSWKSCTMMGVACAASLYLIFILWLNMPFPEGVIHF